MPKDGEEEEEEKEEEASSKSAIDSWQSHILLILAPG